jgi:glycosyltransferase involved in cell wall biosynthesis
MKANMLWHILDTGSIWLKEFACAMGTLAPTANWCPEIRNFGHWEKWERSDVIANPPLEMTRFPLQRGYARFPIAQLFPFEKALAGRLQRSAARREPTALICTAPFYAPVAELWQGPVIYYLTDLTKKYAGMNAKQIVGLDRRMCRVACAVCPNSTRIAEYLSTEAACDPGKLTVIPNATRAQNILDHPPTEPAEAPAEMAGLPRPIVGVIGNLAGNMDWLLIRDAIDKSEGISWAFVGPTDMGIPDREQAGARSDLLSRGGRVRFLGPKPYGELCRYARSFDAAFMPYRKHEPTYSGSATRFYEHLAACRPILSSRGFHELLSKEPLLKLVNDGEDVARELQLLKSTGFRDGVEELRWRASQDGTWLVRARTLMAAATRAIEGQASEYPGSGAQGKNRPACIGVAQ